MDSFIFSNKINNDCLKNHQIIKLWFNGLLKCIYCLSMIFGYQTYFKQDGKLQSDTKIPPSEVQQTKICLENSRQTLCEVNKAAMHPITVNREYQRGKYHCTVDLLFDWFGNSCMTTDNFCLFLQNRLFQTSQTGGQWYCDTSPFSIPCCKSSTPPQCNAD